MATSNAHPEDGARPAWRIVEERLVREGRRCAGWRALDANGQTIGLASFDGPKACSWVEATLEVVPRPDTVELGAELLRELVAGAAAAGATRVTLEYRPTHKISTEVLRMSGLPWHCDRSASSGAAVRGTIDCKKENKQ